MELIRIKETHPTFETAYGLYERAFPPEERRDRDELLRVMKDERYHFCVLRDGDFVGIMLYWDLGKYTYWEHFAVREDLRNRGYGTEALRLLREAVTAPLVFEIEIPETEMQKRRERFYLRNGFLKNEHKHIQPKYRPDDPDFPLLILSDQKVLTAEEYAEFRQDLTRYVEYPGGQKKNLP